MTAEDFIYRGRRIVFDHIGTGPSIVFLHNPGASRLIWADQVHVLAKQYKVFAIDMLGYGDSDKGSRSDYTLEYYTDMLAGFINEHKLGTVALVGNCVGSATALSYTLRCPCRVSSLVLINPATYATIGPRPLGVLIRLAVALPRTARLVSLLKYAKLPRLTADLMLRSQLGRPQQFSALLTKPHVKQLRDNWTDRGRLQPLVDSAIVANFTTAFAALDHAQPDSDFPPVCTIWGKRNPILSPGRGLRLNETVLRPDREEWLANCGHLPMLEDSDRVTGIIQSFLDEGRRFAA